VPVRGLAPLLDGVFGRSPREHRESDQAFRRRRTVVAVTGVVGTALLGRSLSRPPGSSSFYAHTAAVAATWVVGGAAAGRLHLGYEPPAAGHRPLAVPIATGAAAFAGLYGCARIARHVPVLAGAVRSVLAYADKGDSRAVLVTALVSGAAEEVFFRGALYAAVPEGRQVPVTAAAYTATTLATRNPSLVLAAGGMGTLFALQRRATGGIQASTITHLVWTTLVLRFLPPLFADPPD